MINTPGETYFGGPKCIEKVQAVDRQFPSYAALMAGRIDAGKSTSRKDYYYDILMDLSEVD